MEYFHGIHKVEQAKVHQKISYKNKEIDLNMKEVQLPSINFFTSIIERCLVGSYVVQILMKLKYMAFCTDFN